MTISRRSFLRTGSMFGLTASLPLKMIALAQQKASQLGGPGFPVPKAVLSDTLYNITRAMFTQNIRTKFSLSLGGVRLIDVTLMNVLNLNPPNVKSDGTTPKECFSLLFIGSRELALRQNTYNITHGKLGSFQLLLVPGERNDANGLHYEAIINRLYP